MGCCPGPSPLLGLRCTAPLAAQSPAPPLCWGGVEGQREGGGITLPRGNTPCSERGSLCLGQQKWQKTLCPPPRHTHAASIKGPRWRRPSGSFPIRLWDALPGDLGQETEGGREGDAGLSSLQCLWPGHPSGGPFRGGAGRHRIEVVLTLPGE